jgi:hypothetical protein
MICNTAVKDGLLDRNPCQITGAMNPKPKKKPKVATTSELQLFVPVRGGSHLNDRVFNENVSRIAAKDVGRKDLSAHDLRRFAGSKNAQVATLTENMARLGHKTVERCATSTPRAVAMRLSLKR